MKIAVAFIFLLMSTLSLYSQNSNTEYAYKWQNEVLATDAPRWEGESFRIELLKIRTYNPNDPDLKMLSKYGKLYPEKNLKNGMIRLMLGDFSEIDKAKPVLSKVRSMGFTSAAIVKYLDGFRQE